MPRGKREGRERDAEENEGRGKTRHTRLLLTCSLSLACVVEMSEREERELQRGMRGMRIRIFHLAQNHIDTFQAKHPGQIQTDFFSSKTTEMKAHSFWTDPNQFPGLTRQHGKKRQRDADAPTWTGSSVGNSSSQTAERNAPRPPLHPPPPWMLAMDNGAADYWKEFTDALDALLDHYFTGRSYGADSLQQLGGVQSRLHQHIEQRMASRSVHFHFSVP